MERVLIIDDDSGVRRALAMILRDAGFVTLTAPNGERGIENCRECEPDAIILDLTMPGIQGMETLDILKSEKPHIPVIIYTGTGNVTRAVEAMRKGAADFLEKPVKAEELVKSLEMAVSLKRLKRENAFLAGQYLEKMGLSDMVAQSSAMQESLQRADRLAPASKLHVLIQGETGTGKELMARYLHCRSPRMAAPFIIFNCAAMPADLIASELFGYAQGAFTSSNPEGRKGKLTLAEGGTLFLDEIGELPLALQSMLLRVLDSGEYSPLGSEKSLQGDFRIISATNRDLDAMAGAGEFREDLLFRLKGCTIELSPLRNRIDDIEPMAILFARQAAARMNLPGLELPAESVEILKNEPWPGNARELRNTIERAAVMLFPQSRITPDIIREAICAGGVGVPENQETAISADELHELHDFTLPQAGLDLETFTLKLVGAAFVKCGRDLQATARYLGISKEALQYRLRRLAGISRKK